MGYTKEKRFENKYISIKEEIIKEIHQEEEAKFNSGSLDVRLGAERALDKFTSRLMSDFRKK